LLNYQNIKLQGFHLTTNKNYKQMKKYFALGNILFFVTCIHLNGQNREIKIDYTKETGQFNTMFNECIGAGRANEGLRADWQNQLAIVKNECEFKYIRMHGLLTDDMGVYREDKNGTPEYNYQYIDVLYDYLLEIGMKPFVELSFMPSALASGTRTVFWWKGNITPPKDYNKWEDLIRNVVQHWTDRYGKEEVKTWYFEVWNEPNHNSFWAGTQEEYFKLYKYTAQAIKSVNPEYRVGGPATAGSGWIPEMIKYCENNTVPIDFISTHNYGVKKGFLDEFGNAGTHLNKDKSAVSGAVINSRKHIKNSTKPTLELHYTEWSSSYTPSDPFHDTYIQAPYILEKLKQVGDAANSMSYWVFTDIFEEVGIRFTPFHGGFGLLNYQGIKKPAFWAYNYLNKLGQTELVNSDKSSWACKSDKGDFNILLWDYTYTLPNDSSVNQVFYVKNLPSNPKGNVSLEINNVPKGNYKLNIYKIGYKSNDAYTNYFLMGKPKQLTKQQVETLKQQSNGLPVSSENIIINKSQSFKKEIAINENDVFLLDFKRQKK
jgi:xylan 1,4-beta-xylosidase